MQYENSHGNFPIMNKGPHLTYYDFFLVGDKSVVKIVIRETAFRKLDWVHLLRHLAINDKVCVSISTLRLWQTLEQTSKFNLKLRNTCLDVDCHYLPVPALIL